MSARDDEAPPTLVPILMYHSISDMSTAAFRPFTVSPTLFSSHVDLLRAAGYRTVPMTELAELRTAGGQVNERTVVLTFDDGFRDFVTHALPILAAAGCSSTLFVPTGYVGGTSRWLVAERETQRELVSWSELADLQSVGVEVGAHSHSHPQLDLLSRAEAAREISLSKSLLEDHLQTPVTSFAYPFGYSRPAIRELVEALGFLSAVGVADLVSSPADEAFAIPRLTVTADTTPARLAEMLADPRGRSAELRSSSRALASRVLRQTRLKKRTNAPGSSPVPPTKP